MCCSLGLPDIPQLYPSGYLLVDTDEVGISFHRRSTDVQFMTGDRLYDGKRQRVTIRIV